MDALPVGNGIVRHACGHDSHMAIMLSFAEELSYYPDVNINVAFLFQPAEELCDGAKRVLQHEIFKSMMKICLWCTYVGGSAIL